MCERVSTGVTFLVEVGAQTITESTRQLTHVKIKACRFGAYHVKSVKILSNSTTLIAGLELVGEPRWSGAVYAVKTGDGEKS